MTTTPSESNLDHKIDLSYSSWPVNQIDSTGLIVSPPKPEIVTFSHLSKKLESYISPGEMKQIRNAFRFADEKHLGQFRKSGEPYISHPLAVAEICADWKLDAQAIMAALLHDVVEDQGVKLEELI